MSPNEAAQSGNLSTRYILRFYTPLALSWIFMAIESPVAIGLISRLPQKDVNTAAFTILMALSMWIESPVIDLLSTSTTLGKNKQHFGQLTRFTIYLIGWVTFAHALVALTPLFDVIVFELVGAPKDVGEAVRLPMAIMIPWSGFIGWRRYLQGILIRHGRTRLVGFGTLVRVLTMIVSGVGLYLATPWSGILIASVALVLSVAGESLFIHAVSRPVVREHFTEDSPIDEPLTTEKLLKFHMPLTATTMVMFLANPLVSAALSRAPNAVLSLAAWQVAGSLMWLMRTIVYALPEVVITLQGNEQANRKLLRFCVGVGLSASLMMLFLGSLELDVVFFREVLKANPTTAAAAHIAFFTAAALPLVGALQSYVRGMLTAYHLTVSRLYAIQVSLSCMIIMLALGVALRFPGVLNAALAMTVAQTLELGILARSWQKGRRAALAAGT